MGIGFAVWGWVLRNTVMIYPSSLSHRAYCYSGACYQRKTVINSRKNSI